MPVAVLYESLFVVATSGFVLVVAAETFNKATFKVLELLASTAILVAFVAVAAVSAEPAEVAFPLNVVAVITLVEPFIVIPFTVKIDVAGAYVKLAL